MWLHPFSRWSLDTPFYHDFQLFSFFLGGEHTLQLYAPWAYGGHDLSWENGWQIGKTLPQPIHECRRKMDDRFWSQGHLPTGQSGDPWILQKGLYFGHCIRLTTAFAAHGSNLDLETCVYIKGVHPVTTFAKLLCVLLFPFGVTHQWTKPKMKIQNGYLGCTLWL